MAFTTEYSDNWKDLGSVLVYQSPTFQFRSHVVITDFEGCLIKKLPPAKLYHAIDPKSISAYNEDFIKEIKKESIDYSIVVISNVFGNGKLIIDSLKYKVESFCKQFDIPVLCLFAVKKNRLSKPHTGMWMFLNGYFKKKGESIIQKACVVSDFGGRLAERETRKGDIRIRPDNTDLDRAFAHNIGIPYHTILEYLDPEKKEKFNWNGNCLDPDLRELYVKKLSEYQNPNIFSRLFGMGEHDKYMIIIYGAPRSGKTTLAKEILNKWRDSNYGKSHAIKRFGLDKYSKAKRLSATKKALANRISVIIDGLAHTNELREPFEKLASEYKTPILYIEVNPGLGMAHIFNHVAVETSIDEDVELYDIKEYHFYKSKVVRPKNVLLYCPVIKKTKQVMQFRYS